MSDTNFTNFTTPITADWLNVVNDFVYGNNEETQTATSGQTVFNLTTMNTRAGMRVYINGIKQIPTSSYSITSSTQIVFTEGVPLNAVVEFVG